jgi:hypothetical protein
LKATTPGFAARVHSRSLLFVDSRDGLKLGRECKRIRRGISGSLAGGKENLNDFIFGDYQTLEQNEHNE